MKTPWLLVLIAVGLAGWAAAPHIAARQVADEQPSNRGRAREVIPGRFIVTLRDTSDPGRVAADHGVRPDFVYLRAIRGFAGSMADAARSGLLRDRRVLRVEPDVVMSATPVELNATWGLDRIDQRALPLSTTFKYVNTGAGVTAYILDTGIRFDHVEFVRRVTSGYDAIDGGSADDCNGHGTHVSGTVGGTTFGVAKRVSLVAVRVLACDGSGSSSTVISGLDWILAHEHRPAVVNISIGGGTSSSLDDAVRSVISSGVSVVIAAGNGDASGVAQNACNFSPARVGAALTISASNKYDRKPSWANYGSCVDWFAPGTNIASAWYTSSTAAALLTGTSMATPHVTGVVALYLQTHPAATPSAVHDALNAATTKGIVLSAASVNNHLLFSNY